MKFAFSRQIFEKCSYIELKKIRPVGAELFHSDGQTWRIKSFIKPTYVLYSYNQVNHPYI
jgi:hypothetical protein